jgi:hypothetical protein
MPNDMEEIDAAVRKLERYVRANQWHVDVSQSRDHDGFARGDSRGDSGGARL